MNTSILKTLTHEVLRRSFECSESFAGRVSKLEYQVPRMKRLSRLEYWTSHHDIEGQTLGEEAINLSNADDFRGIS